MENSAEIDFVKLIASGMLLAFVLASAIIFFVLIYQRRMAQQALNVQNLKIDHQGILIQSAIQVAEDEKRLFASNLHDEIGAQLAIAKITLSSIEVEDQAIDTSETISQTLKIMDDMSSSIRSISYNLTPPVLLKLGLRKAIEDYVSKIPTSSLKVSFNSSIGQQRFKTNEELQAYRIIQEATSNAIKHAQCTRIEIQLRTMGSAFELTISDNGKGFTNRKSNGMGILNMQSRAKLVQFILSINSSQKGTEINMKPNTELL